jgi:hypothetical protein
VDLAARVATIVLGAGWLLASAATRVLAADPTASPGSGGDVRTTPAAPGLVGDPLVAVVGVAAVAAIAILATLLAVRFGDRRPR